MACGCGCGGEEEREPDPVHGEDGTFSWLWRAIVPGALFVLALTLGDRIPGGRGALVLFLAAYALCGWPVLKEAGEALLRRDFFNEFTLMSAASLAAIFLGETAEAAGVMLFYSIGEAVQELAAGRSRRSIRSLLAAKPQTARLLRGDDVVDVPPGDIPVGSTLLVKPGDRIALDGVVLSGGASLDMASLTGESAPVPAEKGDAVYSGALCLGGDLVVRTTALAADSMVGRILAMVEHAVEAKSRTERFITAFARRYTRMVVGIAALVALLPPLASGGGWSVWAYRSLVLLVVSCPCALFLSVPLAFFAGIGAASRQGILVKGGQVFDALARAGGTIVFDKTGTLTEGKLSLVRIVAADGFDEDAVLRLAALAEARSNHPIAAAIVAAAGEKGGIRDTTALRDIAGKGIAATAAEGEILVGNAALLRDRGVAFAETPGGETAAYVALDGVFAGCLLLADRMKAGAADALRDLRSRRGAKLFMLTGDREEAASAAAAALGLDGYRAGLLPEGKVAAFRALSPDGAAVFVGDGVNDAPVLAAAGVGVAMGALGSAAAVEAADAVILDDSVSRLPALFRIAARTRGIAGQNILFALGVKGVIMVLGILGLSGLWAAVFADVGVALLAVGNSLRLTRG